MYWQATNAFVKYMPCRMAKELSNLPADFMFLHILVMTRKLSTIKIKVKRHHLKYLLM